DEVVPEGVPGQFGYHTMVLMVVPPVMRENNIRFKVLHALNRGFDLSKLRRKEAIPEGVNNDLRVLCLCQHGAAATARLVPTLCGTREHHPKDAAVGITFDQRQDRAAGTDLDVIRMSSQAKDRGGRPLMR